MLENILWRTIVMRTVLSALSVAAVLMLPLAAQAQNVFETPLMLKDGANAVVARIHINEGGLEPGWHGLHFHAVGDCSDTGKFLLSKGHINHGNKKHGLLNAEGPDEGDLPNLFVNADGSANAEVSSVAVRLAGEKGLKATAGTALVIHAAQDDHSSQPIGNAGARVACAVIK
jgi:Cu-Zn family superoxide dismutase